MGMGSSNSGARNLLQCNYQGCDRDGCQPRFVGIQELATPGAGAAACTVKGATFYNYETENVATAATDGQTGTGEDTECSSRGVCDGSTGICGCFEGYTGNACSVQPSWSKSPTRERKKGSRDTFIFKKNSQQLSFFFCFGLSNFESEETKYKKIKEHKI